VYVDPAGGGGDGIHGLWSLIVSLREGELAKLTYRPSIAGERYANSRLDKSNDISLDVAKTGMIG